MLLRAWTFESEAESNCHAYDKNSNGTHIPVNVRSQESIEVLARGEKSSFVAVAHLLLAGGYEVSNKATLDV